MRGHRMTKREESKRPEALYPPSEIISDEEFRRRLAAIEEWRKKELAALKKKHPDYFKDQN